MRSTQWRGVLCFGVLWMTSGCITDATTELTSAPTDAISDLTNGTSAAVSDLTAPLSDVTSSTTPGEASLAPARAKKRLHLFTASSYDNLRSDISRGYGEYLVSLPPWPVCAPRNSPNSNHGCKTRTARCSKR